MEHRTSIVSDGVFYGVMSWIMAGIFGLGIAFAYAELGNGTWAGGLGIAAIVAVIGGWIFARWGAGGELPPPNSVRIDVAPAPTTARSRAAERRAADALPTIPTREEVREVWENPPSARDAGVAVGAALKSATETVKEVAADTRERVADAVSPDDTDAGAERREPEARQPATLAAPREGGPDDLKLIKGVGPKLEAMLHDLGYYHFDQIAAWTPEEIAWVDTHIEGFSGRATRDEWVPQAKTLAAGGSTEFSRRQVEDEGPAA